MIGNIVGQLGGALACLTQLLAEDMEARFVVFDVELVGRCLPPNLIFLGSWTLQFP